MSSTSLQVYFAAEMTRNVFDDECGRELAVVHDLDEATRISLCVVDLGGPCTRAAIQARVQVAEWVPAGPRV